METGWVFIVVILGLLVFGGIYNHVVAGLEEKGHDRGYTAYLVVGGTLVTVLGAIPLIGVESAGMVLACFAASGLPMVVGSSKRHSQQREEFETRVQAIVREALNDEKTSGWL
jgi:hypothetical protein